MNKNQLYESIMRSIAKEVKKAINEVYEFDKPDFSEYSDLSKEDYECLATAIHNTIINGKLYGDETINDEKYIGWEIINGKIAFAETGYIWADRDGGDGYTEYEFGNEELMNTIYNELYGPIDLTNIILEKYNLSYIFALNEDNTPNIFDKFKKPLAQTLEKLKNKFGKDSANLLADIIKKAEKKGKRTLYGVLTLITLFSGTLPVNANVTNNFIKSFSDSAAISSMEMSKARGFNKEKILSQYKDIDVDAFYDLFEYLENDEDNLYASCGVGCNENQQTAESMAKEDAINNLKEEYGENAIDKYDIQFKVIQNKSFQQKGIENGQTINKAFYTVLVVAYQEK